MNRISFFLTPRQRDETGWGVPEHPLQLGACSKAGEAVKRVEGRIGFHKSTPYSFRLNLSSFQRTFTDDKLSKMTHTKTGRPIFILSYTPKKS